MSTFAGWVADCAAFGSSTDSGGFISKTTRFGSGGWVDYNSSGTQSASTSNAYDPWVGFESEEPAEALVEKLVGNFSDWVNYNNSGTHNTSTDNANTFGSGSADMNSSGTTRVPTSNVYDPFAGFDVLEVPAETPALTQSRIFYPIGGDDTAEDVAMDEDEDEDEDDDDFEIPEDETHRCYYSDCHATFSSEDNLRQHVIDVHVQKDYMCGYCDEEFVHSQELRVHLDMSHPYSGARPLFRRRYC